MPAQDTKAGTATTSSQGCRLYSGSRLFPPLSKRTRKVSLL